ncbi:hypothetical protein BFW01_g1697 [Lasiodiplodia theobromae]|nr:hypothetical protein BFW01_g1697 [Lasiodiplodia theobromae]
MAKTFGNAYTSIEPKKRGPRSQMIQSFEATKMAFGSHRGVSDEQLFEIENVVMKRFLEDNANLDRYDPDENTLQLTWKEMQSFFNPVVDQVISLVESQVDQTAAKGRKIGRVILVGGFGGSEYLNEKMETWCRLKGDITLTCPPQCQAAVVRGAAIRGLEGLKPKSRIARRHYGYGVSKRFVEGVHDERRSFIHRYHNEKYCDDLVSWKIRKGQSIDATTKAPFTVSKTICDTDRRYNLTLSLYYCTYEESSLYDDAWKAENVGEVMLSFTDAEIDAAPREYNKRKRRWYCKVEFTVEINLAADKGTHEFKTSINDRPGGAASIKFHDS